MKAKTVGATGLEILKTRPCFSAFHCMSPNSPTPAESVDVRDNA